MNHGTNHIFKILDGEALEEDFKILVGSNDEFKDNSISVYNPFKKS